jgi:uncharacterized repeat protein (TIGR02543 family)
MTPGSHIVALSLTGYNAYSTTVTVTAGATSTVNASLIATPPPNGTITVTSTPSGATVGLDGSNVGTTPLSAYVATPGSHVITVSLSGYNTYTTTVTVTAGSNSSVNTTLVVTPPPNGTVVINSVPSGATASIDGNTVGTTPVTVSNVPPGSHIVTIVLATYNTYTTTVSVTAGQIATVNATLVLTPPTVGSIAVTSVPTGAAVTIDGVAIGNAPVSQGGFLPGSHVVALSLTGYNPYQVTITVTAGQTTNVNATLVQTPPQLGTIATTSTPTGAAVTIDGSSVGIAPVTSQGLSPGNHVVMLTLSGYNPYTTTVNVVAGQTTLLNVNLTPTPVTTGTLSVSSSPNAATVTVNGNVMGPTPVLVTQLPPGNYTVTIALAGYQTWSSTVIVQAATTTPVNVTLVANPPPVVTTGNLNISSNPTGGLVVVNGSGQGTSPVSMLNLAPGQYTVQITLAGYQPWSATVSVVANQTTTVNAALVAIPYNLTVTVQGQGSTSPAATVSSYLSGAALTYTAIPAAGWMFTKWTLNGLDSTSNPLSFNIAADSTLVAVFTQIVVPPTQYAVSITAGAGGTTQPTPGAYLQNAGSSVTIQAIPADGYIFDSWTGDVTGTTPAITFTVNKNTSLMANFKKPAGGGVSAGLISAAGLGLMAIIGKAQGG